jgi:hypothetical protein
VCKTVKFLWQSYLSYFRANEKYSLLVEINDDRSWWKGRRETVEIAGLWSGEFEEFAIEDQFRAQFSIEKFNDGELANSTFIITFKLDEFEAFILINPKKETINFV